MEKQVKVIILSSIFVRGEMFEVGSEVEVNEREAKELISRGVATDETNIAIEEDTLKTLEEMTVKELIDYATELGIEVPKNPKKQELIDLINSDDIEE